MSLFQRRILQNWRKKRQEKTLVKLIFTDLSVKQRSESQEREKIMKKRIKE